MTDDVTVKAATGNPASNPRLFFEPHNGFGGEDPDGNPWPFGYISQDFGIPIFELSDVLGTKPERLRELALQFAAAPDLLRELVRARECISALYKQSRPDEDSPLLSLATIDAAIAKARGE